MDKNRFISADPDKISKILCIPWNYKPGMVDSMDDNIDEQYLIDEANKSGTFEFTISSNKGDVRLSFINFLRWNVMISCSHGSIHFCNITRIAYISYKNLIIFESKTENEYSQLSINRQGSFTIMNAVPIKDYHLSSWCEIEEQEQKKLDERKNTT